MLQTISGIFGNPNIPVRIPNDDTTFNPKEYPNVVFLAQGRVSGKIRLVHGGVESDESGQGLISTRIWVIREKDQEEVKITPTFNAQTFTLTLETPPHWGTNTRIYHETMIQYPSSLRSTESLTLDAPLTSLSAGEELANLFFGLLRGTFSNASASLKSIRAEHVRIQTSNASIEGTFEAGLTDLLSSNGSIHAQVNVRDAENGDQGKVLTETSNASIDVQVSTTAAAKGLWMENTSSNGRLVVGALLAKADRASVINAVTTNARIECNIDASQTGQPLHVKHKTGNGSIKSSIMVPVNQPFRGTADTSNASVEVNLTEDFQGRFELATNNASCTVEGSELVLEKNSKTAKSGYRVQSDGQSDIKIHSSNGSTALRFYEAGESLAAGNDEKVRL
ncbi:hypothetical protein BGZ83_000659 [Gryganskiella cystojenkinii]|nr:hypothetical protein BGZ83_000659 [Gryganskiella cystojenkinii]